jgi:hypothetical protein
MTLSHGIVLSNDPEIITVCKELGNEIDKKTGGIYEERRFIYV